MIQTLFTLLYNQFAWSYDVVSHIVSRGQWREWQQAALPYLTGPRVLEIGHGPGHMLITLVSQGYDAVGLDLSPSMGRLALRKLVNRQEFSRLVCGRAESPPFAAERFDGVLATFPAPFITMPETVNAIHRILRPGGRLVIVPEARLTGNDPYTRGLEWLYRITGQRQNGSVSPLDSLTFWKEKLSAAPFTVNVLLVPLPHSIVTVVVGERSGVS